MEEIVTFLPGQMPGEERFAVEMTGITYPDPRYHIEREHSPLHCMEYVISGEGHIVMDGREYRPKAGDAYLLAAGKDHSYWADADRPWKKIWMNISGRHRNYGGGGKDDTQASRSRFLGREG